MSKALLINPSYRRTYGSNEGGLAFPVFPVLGLASLAGAARARGHEVTILDLSYRAYDPELLRRVIRAERPDVVGITATTPLANQLRDISHLVKDLDEGIVTVGGGAHPSALPEVTLRQSALDLVVVGEADFAIADLLDGCPYDQLPGAHYRSGDEIVSRPPELLDNLDSLPFPSWETYPTECHAEISRIVARHRPVATVEFSRGCIYKCDFCGSKNTMGQGYRKKSPERCADELARLARAGYREALLVDDIFTSDVEWAAAVCEEIIRQGAGIAWTCANGIRVDGATRELFELMRRAGCYRVHFGFESGNDEVIRQFGKGGRASLENGRRAVQLSRAAGLVVNGYFMVGLATDTVETMDETIEFAKSVPLDAMKCGLTVPFPGTPMFQELHEAGRVVTYDWDEYTVYNDASQLYEHPNLEWSAIHDGFRRFYRETYLRNPRYMARRAVHSVRSGELIESVRYFSRFLKVMLSRRTQPERESYAYESRWRPLDLHRGSRIDPPNPVRARKGAGPQGRDGLVGVGSRTVPVRLSARSA